jgi:hypothetical protein
MWEGISEVRHKSHVDGLALNPARQGESPANNRRLARIWAVTNLDSN